ncbi:MAG: cell division protein ZapA [Leptospiraceae bacterium]|nr:MAG: cell division protein ZapA [Leptospiraceae bacterium]
MKTTINQKTKELQRVEVEIFGQEYTLKSTDASVEYIIMLANYVDAKMKDLSQQLNHKIPVSQLAILAALNIADELFQERNKTIDEELIVNKTRQLIQLLDEGILGDPII